MADTNVVVGIDEVGRGAWAGPLVVGAVVLSGPIAGISDSKLLTKIQRVRLAEIIQSQALAIGLGWVKSSEIDQLGLTKSMVLAIERSLAPINIAIDQIIIDGSINYLLDDPRAKAVIKADSMVPAVSAASIVAKVARDKYMLELSKKFSGYFFDEHVGYGTKKHIIALKSLGPCMEHRMSFKPVGLATNGAS